MLRIFCRHNDEVYCELVLQKHYIRLKRHGWALRCNIVEVWRCAKCNKIISKDVRYRNLHPDDYQVKHFGDKGS